MENYSSSGRRGATSASPPAPPPFQEIPTLNLVSRPRDPFQTDIQEALLHPPLPRPPRPGDSLELVREAVVEAGPGARRFLPETHQVFQALGEAQKFFGAPGCQQGR